jgi:hypothetical protein
LVVGLAPFPALDELKRHYFLLSTTFFKYFGHGRQNGDGAAGLRVRFLVFHPLDKFFRGHSCFPDDLYCFAEGEGILGVYFD